MQTLKWCHGALQPWILVWVAERMFHVLRTWEILGQRKRKESLWNRLVLLEAHWKTVEWQKQKHRWLYNHVDITLNYSTLKYHYLLTGGLNIGTCVGDIKSVTVFMMLYISFKLGDRMPQPSEEEELITRAGFETHQMVFQPSILSGKNSQKDDLIESLLLVFATADLNKCSSICFFICMEIEKMIAVL